VIVRTSSWLQYLPISGEVGHWDPPYPRWRLEVVPAARVYEIHGPQAWNNLCLAYPAPSCMAYPSCRPDSLIEPDWQAVSQDWDGVHLSVGGLLTTERVRGERQEHRPTSMGGVWRVRRGFAGSLAAQSAC
jgi:hypothetical protein